MFTSTLYIQTLSLPHLAHRILGMANSRPDLLAPYLKLDQGGKVQAECESLQP